MKEITLYTFGYLSQRAERIFLELIATRVPIVDVRYAPTSRHWQYTQEALAARRGIIYRHLGDLGNELYEAALNGRYAESAIKIHDLDAGLAALKAILDEYGKAALLCACTSKKTCHRIKVAEEAQRRFGVKVVHF